MSPTVTHAADAHPDAAPAPEAVADPALAVTAPLEAVADAAPVGDTVDAETATAHAVEADDGDAAPAGEPPTAAAAPAKASLDPAQHLKTQFPALFAGAPKPLKLRIQADIQERVPGQYSRQALSAFLRRYTGSTGYLIALSRASQRFDLDGQPAGELVEEHRQAALDELKRRRALSDERRALEDQQRRNRAQLLHDFQGTTLTRPNFCALKGVPEDQLDSLLETARREAEEWAANRPPQRERDPRGGPRRDDSRQPGRPDARRAGGRPAGGGRPPRG